MHGNRPWGIAQATYFDIEYCLLTRGFVDNY